jgi:Fe-S cluster assembly iron-binding protein IscA
MDITPRAAHRLRHLMTKEDNPQLCLRVQVESGGCHGFQYLMSLVSSKDIQKDEDTLLVVNSRSEFPAIESQSPESLGNGDPKVFMDQASLELLEGSKIDYTMELIGSQFKIVDNPRATSSCGCGTSFDVKGDDGGKAGGAWGF